ncbi:MAG: histone H1-like repetitive region-containing protein [Treponema sp.]|nr:histone H1-like repetitive region-containing protein [Treponema sp.]
MATIKKTAKKTAAKKPAAKKPAAKKTTAKKAAPKASSKKAPAAKKPAVKKTVVKTTAAKKPAAKATAAKKAAVKKPAAKTTAAKKPAAKTTAAKPAIKKAAAIKTSQAVSKPVEVVDANIKLRDLFDAYTQGKLPFAQGYIVSSFFSDTSAYSIYEIVSYAGVKEIFAVGEGLQFVSGGKKLHILVEPDTYHFKSVEPVSRAEGERIPKRFNELDTYITKNQNRIYIAKEPGETTGSFTVLKPKGAINFAVVFYQLPDLFESLAAFFEESLNRQRKVPQSDAKKVALQVVDILKKTMSFEGEYQ